MVSSSKILTVSYGTFSCTAEGFEDPLSVVKDTTQFFRGVVKEDRFFGAEPPQFDPELAGEMMRAQIAADERDGHITVRPALGAASAGAMAAALGAGPSRGEDSLPSDDHIEEAARRAAEEAAKDAQDDGADVLSGAVAKSSGAIPADSTQDQISEPAEAEALAAADVAPAPPAVAPNSAADGDDSIAARLQRIRDVVATPAAGMPMADDDGLIEDAEPDMRSGDVLDEPGFDSSTLSAMLADMQHESPEDTTEILDDLAEVSTDATGDADTLDLSALTAAVKDSAANALENTTGEAAEAASDMTGAVQDAVADAADALENTAEQAADVAADMASDARDVVADAVDTAQDAAQDAAEGVDDLAAQAGEAAGSVAETASDAAEAAQTAISDMADTAEDAAAAVEATAQDAVADVVDTTSDVASNAAEAAEEKLNGAAAALADKAKEAADTKDEAATAPRRVTVTPRRPAQPERQPTRARVVKVKRAVFDKAVAEGQLEEISEAPNETGGLSTEEEDELARELEAVKAELSGGLDDWDEEELAPNPEWEDSGLSEDWDDDADEAPLKLDQPVSDDWDEDLEAEAEAPAAPVEDPSEGVRKAVKMASPARAMLTEQAVEDDDASRILDQTNSEMEEPEGNRRRSAIAHLRAAVAATRADRLLGRKADTEKEAAEPYREDLANVVRPRRPQAAVKTERPAAAEQARPAPLKLVAEQRVPDVEVPQEEAGAQLPVRPRRVSIADEPAPAGADTSGFADYADSVGARELPELLEAAAAYMSFVEGRDQFSRPQLMTTVRQAEQEDFSREDRLRSFGQLLREGKIEKTSGGRFTASERISFKPRRAG